jgi:hypothetical protein
MCIQPGQEARGAVLVTENVREREGGGRSVSELEEQETTLQ